MRMGMQHVGRHRRLLSVIACLSTELQQDPGNLRVCFASSWGSVFFRRLKHIVACKLTCERASFVYVPVRRNDAS